LIDPDDVCSTVTTSENGTTVPLTASAVDGDIVTIKDERVDES
jgi:hypothetical protein